jgi:hydroxymethylpyrimidine/phosphomethylpyrimidine kinase
MLGCRATVEAVVESLPPDLAVPIVLDPVLATSSGGALIDADGFAAMRDKLFPRVTVLTPNIPEAAVLVSAAVATSEPELITQAQRILDYGVQAVLLKGGHGEGEESVDLLISRTNIERLVSARVRGASRGTGCALASAIAAGLASSASLSDASEHAKRYVAEMLNPER